MKTIFKSTILLAAAGLFVLTSCDDDNDSNPTIAQPTTFVLNEPAITGFVDMEKTPSVVLTWSQPTPYNDFNAPVVPTYTVQVSPTGQFNKAFDETLEDNTGADFVNVSETYTTGKDVNINLQNLNRQLLQLCGWTEATTPERLPLAVRVKSAIRDASFREYNVIYSNVVTLNTVPYYVELKPADPEIWWLIGADIADGSWGSDLGKCVVPMQTIDGAEYDSKTGQGEIKWTGYLAGNGFKLVKIPGKWDDQYGQGDSFGEYLHNDGGSGNITVPEAGIYTVTLNTAKNTLNVEKADISATVFGGMSIAGTFNEWGDTEMTPCSTGWENHDWYITHSFAAGDKVKVKQTGTWDFNKGGSFVNYSEGMYVYGVDNGADLVVEEAGTYQIFFNDITGYIRFIKQ